MNDRPIPEHVLRTWPSVALWTWLSPLRLRGEEAVSRSVHLVVIDEHTDQHAMGQAIPDYRIHDAAYVSEVFGRLRLKLAEDIAMRVGCEDGTPVRAEHSALVCSWCGKRWDEHEGLGVGR